MTPPPQRVGIGSVLIDLILVALILTCAGALLYCAYQVLASAGRAAARWGRRLRGPGGET